MKTSRSSSPEWIVLLLLCWLVGCAKSNKVRGLAGQVGDGGGGGVDNYQEEEKEEDANYYSLRERRALTGSSVLFDGEEPHIVVGGTIRMGGSAGKPDKDNSSYNAIQPKRPTIPPTVRPLVAPPKETEKPTTKPTDTNNKPTPVPTPKPPTSKGPTPLPTFGSASSVVTECTGGSQYWFEERWKDRIRCESAADCGPTLNQLCCMSEFCFCNMFPSSGGTCTA